MNKYFCCVMCLAFLVPVVGQAQDVAPNEPQNQEAQTAPESKTSTEQPKKLVDSATINLRTTVTGSQEQPRVLYIMPWQSPAAEELEIEMLSSQQDAVFGHIEREEMLRGLEAAGEFDDAKK